MTKNTKIEAVENADGIVSQWLDEAIQYIDDEYSKDRAKAMKYYKGDPLGNEEEGRSKVVIYAVRMAVKKMLPSLLRVFFGSERVVEFVPRTESDVPVADQQNDMMDVVVNNDNDGFAEFHAWFKDALIKKMGIMKWWWDEDTTVEEIHYTGLPAEQLPLLVQEAEARDGLSDLEFAEQTQNPDGSLDFRVKMTFKKQVARFAAVPPEEFVFSPNARSIDDCRLVAHQTHKTISELVAMGFDADELEDLPASDDVSSNDETLERRDQFSDEEGGEPTQNRRVQYAEAYARMDEDGDGISELRCYKLAGTGGSWKLLEPSYVVDGIPFAVLIPDPEPHKLDGMGVSDDVMDLQMIQSNIMRGVLDSLNLTLNPATEVVVGQVNMQDMMNTEIGKVIRARAPGMIREVKHSFVGGEALPILQYFDHMRDERTGLPDAAAGLDADALQSSTASAVNATVTGAQQQIEMVARVFAGTGVKRLFRGLAALLRKNQTVRRTVRLRDTFVPIDPAVWNSELDVSVNVALGTGLVEQKLAVLRGITEAQMGILAQSPDNGIVTKRHLAYTLRKAAELSGFKNSSNFFMLPEEGPEPEKPPSPEAQAQMEKNQIEQAKLQLDGQKLQLEQMKAQADIGIRQQELQVAVQAEQTRMQEIALRNAADKSKAEMEYSFRLAEMHAKMKADVEEEARKNEIQLQKIEIEAGLKREEMLLDAELQREKMQMEAGIKMQIAELDAKMAARAAQSKEVTLKTDPKTGKPTGATIKHTGGDHE